MKQFLEWVTKSGTTFLFNNEYFEHIRGVPMGSKELTCLRRHNELYY